MGTNAVTSTRFDKAGIDAILSAVSPDASLGATEVPDAAPAQFTWEYEKGARPQLSRLYEKAKGAQWNAETDLPWDTDVDPERLAELGMAVARPVLQHLDLSHTPMATWGENEWVRFGMESQRWMLSQFLHGEQGALVCTAKIVETVPWIDAKFYAATQVMDEARHVEVFSKYLETKLDGAYHVNPHLWALLEDIVADSRWDMTYLGMQIMVEGLALAAFGLMRAVTQEPLLKQLLQYVMADEARHIAFGVLSLKEVYEGLSGSEIHERQEFAYEAAVHMRDRLMQQEVWETFGVDAREALAMQAQDPTQVLFRQMLFGKIVPNCKKLGLLDAGDGWLRQKFGELGVLQFEDFPQADEEFETFAIQPAASP